MLIKHSPALQWNQRHPVSTFAGGGWPLSRFLGSVYINKCNNKFLSMHVTSLSMPRSTWVCESVCSPVCFAVPLRHADIWKAKCSSSYVIDYLIASCITFTTWCSFHILRHSFQVLPLRREPVLADFSFLHQRAGSNCKLCFFVWMSISIFMSTDSAGDFSTECVQHGHSTADVSPSLQWPLSIQIGKFCLFLVRLYTATYYCNIWEPSL